MSHSEMQLCSSLRPRFEHRAAMYPAFVIPVDNMDVLDDGRVAIWLLSRPSQVDATGPIVDDGFHGNFILRHLLAVALYDYDPTSSSLDLPFTSLQFPYRFGVTNQRPTYCSAQLENIAHLDLPTALSILGLAGGEPERCASQGMVPAVENVFLQTLGEVWYHYLVDMQLTVHMMQFLLAFWDLEVNASWRRFCTHKPVYHRYSSYAPFHAFMASLHATETYLNQVYEDASAKNPSPATDTVTFAHSQFSGTYAYDGLFAFRQGNLRPHRVIRGGSFICKDLGGFWLGGKRSHDIKKELNLIAPCELRFDASALWRAILAEAGYTGSYTYDTTNITLRECAHMIAKRLLQLLSPVDKDTFLQAIAQCLTSGTEAKHESTRASVLDDRDARGAVARILNDIIRRPDAFLGWHERHDIVSSSMLSGVHFYSDMYLNAQKRLLAGDETGPHDRSMIVNLNREVLETFLPPQQAPLRYIPHELMLQLSEVHSVWNVELDAELISQVAYHSAQRGMVCKALQRGKANGSIAPDNPLRHLSFSDCTTPDRRSYQDVAQAQNRFLTSFTKALIEQRSTLGSLRQSILQVLNDLHAAILPKTAKETFCELLGIKGVQGIIANIRARREIRSELSEADIGQGLDKARQSFAHQIDHLGLAIGQRWVLPEGEWNKLKTLVKQVSADEDTKDRLRRVFVAPAPELLDAAASTLTLWSLTYRIERVFGESGVPPTLDGVVRLSWEYAKKNCLLAYAASFNFPGDANSTIEDVRKRRERKIRDLDLFEMWNYPKLDIGHLSAGGMHELARVPIIGDVFRFPKDSDTEAKKERYRREAKCITAFVRAVTVICENFIQHGGDELTIKVQRIKSRLQMLAENPQAAQRRERMPVLHLGFRGLKLLDHICKSELGGRIKGKNEGDPFRLLIEIACPEWLSLPEVSDEWSEQGWN